jgi:hypothetical protein
MIPMVIALGLTVSLKKRLVINPVKLRILISLVMKTWKESKNISRSEAKINITSHSARTNNSWLLMGRYVSWKQ